MNAAPPRELGLGAILRLSRIFEGSTARAGDRASADAKASPPAAQFFSEE